MRFSPGCCCQTGGLPPIVIPPDSLACEDCEPIVIPAELWIALYDGYGQCNNISGHRIKVTNTGGTSADPWAGKLTVPGCVLDADVELTYHGCVRAVLSGGILYCGYAFRIDIVKGAWSFLGGFEMFNPGHFDPVYYDSGNLFNFIQFGAAGATDCCNPPSSFAPEPNPRLSFIISETEIVLPGPAWGFGYYKSADGTAMTLTVPDGPKMGVYTGQWEDINFAYLDDGFSVADAVVKVHGYGAANQWEIHANTASPFKWQSTAATGSPLTVTFPGASMGSTGNVILTGAV